ncbi:chloramphenicol resistance leader peptide [Brevibacterium antiquum]
MSGVPGALALVTRRTIS